MNAFHTHRGARIVLLLTAAVAVAAGASGAQAARSSLPTLNVVLSVPDPSQAQILVAQEKGYFAAEGLPVNITYASTQAATQIASGQGDVTFQGPLSAFGLVQNGLETSIIYASFGGGYSGQVFARTGINSITDCKTMTAVPNTGTFAWASFYKTLYNASYNLTPLAAAAGVSAVESGQIDCGVNTLGQYGSGVAAGQVHQIVDPTKPSMLPKGFPVGLTEGTIWGLKDHLNQIRPEIVAFIAAMNLAQRYVENTPASTIAQFILQTRPEFAPISSTLELGIEQIKDFAAPFDGYIASPLWSTTLNFYSAALAGLSDTPQWSYGSRVNMSFYQAAIGLPLKAVMTAKLAPGAKGAAKATGNLTVLVKKAVKARRLIGTVDFAHLSGPVTSLQIHLGGPGKTGPLLVTVCTKCQDGHSYSAKLVHAADSAIESNRAYAVITTVKNPNGEVRGQIVPVNS
jgi:ABC-type nitrate/sulfonate/bicarbonate transport system substrate-binding protein